jgi:hypothetical protein
MASKLTNLLGCGTAIVALATPVWAQETLPSPEQMWEMLQAQQKEIERLTSRLEDAETRVAATDEKVEAAGDMIEAQQTAEGGEDGWWKRTQIGGYGELHYNGGDADEIDFHRFVLFVGHDFNDQLRLATELEVEHALSGDGKPGEVEVEQAFIEYDYTAGHQARAGLFLLPVGILNQTHEPPTFYGVERNNVEKNIIPTTWWEGGIGGSGEIANGFSYDLAFHSGLEVPTSSSSAYKIRNGRQKVAKATATDGALTGRIKWTGEPGIEVGVTGQYQDDVTQNAAGLGTSATLIEGHVDMRRGGWGLRALAARWDLDEGPDFTGAGAYGRDVQYGWYVEPSYRFDAGFSEIGLFTRYSEWDNEGGDSTDSKFGQFDLGANVWLHPDVVLKIDGQFEFRPTGRGDNDNRLNLGIGYQF